MTDPAITFAFFITFLPEINPVTNINKFKRTSLLENAVYQLKIKSVNNDLP